MNKIFLINYDIDLSKRKTEYFKEKKRIIQVQFIKRLGHAK